jgi:hypothetical protein
LNGAIAHIKQGLVKRALHMIAFYKTIAQFGVSVAAFIVDCIHALLQFKDSDVMILRCDGNASTFKQIGLCGHVNPVAHD